jgi:ubiquinone/menaquinone biosynthesis C-methylase UbiE
MCSKHYVPTVFMLVASVALAQSKEHEKAHADHMEHHFDPEESAKSFDDAAPDTWQLPDRVIAALNLKRGQIVADIGAGTGYFSVGLAKSEAAPTVYAVDIDHRW